MRIVFTLAHLHVICEPDCFFLALSPCEDIIKAKCSPACLEQRECSIGGSLHRDRRHSSWCAKPAFLFLSVKGIGIVTMSLMSSSGADCSGKSSTWVCSAPYPHSHKDPCVVLHVAHHKTNTARDLDGHSNHNNKY